MGLYKRKITVEDSTITSAVHLILRQSLVPNALGMSRADRPLQSSWNSTADVVVFALFTILFFLWGFAYGLLDTLNFRTTLSISATESSDLQALYFAAYFICPLTTSG